MPFPNIRHWFAPHTTPAAALADAETSERSAQQIQEQINPTALASSPTQEDWYWGRLATGDEEDYYWRRLSDNWFQKDVIPSVSLEQQNHESLYQSGYRCCNPLLIQYF